MKWFKILSSDVWGKSDFIKKIDVSGKKLCVVKTGDKLFVVQNKCPHAGADLSSGWCRDGKIVCPYHRHEFDLVTGRGLAGQGNYVNTYPVEIRDDGIYVGLKENWWKFW
ncbi:MAG: Rieske 2Fe-2S domain-containing protein [Bacteroidota bacterium]